MAEPATQGVQMEFQPEFSAYPARERCRLTFATHLQAGVMEDDNKRSVVSLSAVLDRSGSMSGSKIDLVKRSQEFMMQQLSTKDKLGVIQYDSEVDELLKLARTSEAYKREASLAVQSIQPNSCTNLSGGLFMGIAQQQRNTYLDYEAGVEPGTDQPDNTSVATSDFTDVGSEVSSEYVDVPMAVPMPDVDLPEAEGEEEDQQVAQQQLQMPVQVVEPPQRRGIVQRMTQMWSRTKRPSSSATKAAKTNGEPYYGLLKDGKIPKSSELEKDALRSVFLFTDGLANEGVQDPNQLVEMLQRMLDKTPRVRVYTFGYGTDHSPDLLQRIAAAGSGTYYFIENEESIPTAFADALGGLLSVAAQNVSVEFVPAPGVTVSEVHTAFKTTNGPNGSRTVSVGDMFSQEAKDLLFEVDLPELSAPVIDYTVGHLRISYLDVAGACMRTDELRCVVGRPDEVPKDLVASSTVAIQKARVLTAKTLAEAKKAADAGKYEEARGVISQSLNVVSRTSEQVKGNKQHEAMTIAMCGDLNEALSNMRDVQTYSTVGAKIMCSKAAAHSVQRSAAQECEADWGEEGKERENFSYANVKQMAMRRKAKAWFS